MLVVFKFTINIDSNITADLFLINVTRSHFTGADDPRSDRFNNGSTILV